MKRIAVAFDVHLKGKEEPSSSYQIFKKFCKDFKPHEIILGGDFMDCESISHWNENKKMALDDATWEEEVTRANGELDSLQKLSKKITYMEGNHEAWVWDYLRNNPEMIGTVGLEKELKLEKRGIDLYHYRNPQENLLKRGHLYICHGFYTTMNHTKKHFQEFGCNLIYGHTHLPQEFCTNQKMQQPYAVKCIGCLCSHEASYLKGKPSNWIDGFAFFYLDEKTGNFSLYDVKIIDGSVVINGRKYR